MLPGTCDTELTLSVTGGWSTVKVLEKLKFCNSGILKISSLERNETLTKGKELHGETTAAASATLPPGFVLLVILIGISGIFTIIMWFTEFYMFHILQFVTITQGSASYDMWINPPVKPYVSIYPFNYTNIDDVLNNGATPVVQELGPFVYRETVERINVEFNKNGTVTYQEQRSNEFMPDMSRGNPKHMTIMAPNLPLIGGLAKGANAYLPRLTQPFMPFILDGLQQKPFLELKIDDYFWGYEDDLYTLAQNFASIVHKEARRSKFGIVTGRRGLSTDRITVHSGVGNLDELGIITRYNGQNSLNVWKTDECNRLDGSDGSQFPPTTLNRNSKLYVFHKDLCRRFPLVYKEEVEVVPGVTALRFQAPRNVFDTPLTNPENACFYSDDACPPSGVFNSSPCSGVPVMMSFPHFYLGDPELRKDVLGLSPDPEKHETFVDVHAKLGVSLAGRSRFQINVILGSTSDGMSYFKNLKPGLILPVAWIELKVDKLPDDIKRNLQQMSISISLGEILLKWISLLTLTLSMIFLVKKIILKDCFMANEKLVLPFNK
ncbi:scavenger receptor class B member 1-like [Adelges cooleyi]|uniref:scavenger receptor class B member 1-like n=1 Tax=Adelges cooleyi TaxID=133065 RepID=UPI00217FF0AF|nr:scavenger receptor class B member 1-like [Adelges cooleyi]